MATDHTHRRRARTFALTFGTILAGLSVTVASGAASATTERQGAELLQRVEAGKQTCQRLSPDQFDAIGEYVMGRMVGSPARHKAMDQQIRSRSGASGEAQAHNFMGRRFAGCATGNTPVAFGAMMGMMGMYSGANGGGMPNGNDGANGFGPGMMGRSSSRNDGWSATNTVLAILLAAALVALAAWRPWRRASPKTPLDLLRDRYARGEIDTADYEQRRHALEGLTT